MKYKLIIIAVLLTVVVNADISFEGWVYNNKNFIFDDINYKVLISSNGNSVILKTETLSEAVSLGDCADIGIHLFCFNTSVFELEQQNYKAYLQIYTLQPEIDITRTVSNNILDVGETAVFDVQIRNTGNADAQNVIFTEDFPENVDINNVNNALVQGNSVVWEGNIKQGESHKIHYEIKSLGDFDKQIKASIKYFNGYEQNEIFSDSIRLYSTPVLDIELSTNKDDYEINEEIILNVKLENIANDKIDVENIEVILPESVKGIDADIKKISENKYSWSGDLDENGQKNIDLTLEGTKPGKYFILVTGQYNYQGRRYYIDNIKRGFLVDSKGIEVTTSFDKSAIYNANELAMFYIKVTNKNSFIKITNLEIDTITDIANFDKVRYPSIKPNVTALIINRQIRIPNIEEDRSFPIKLNITYMTDDAEHNTFIEKTINIKPVKLLAATPSISSTNILENSPVEVKLKLENPSNFDIKSVLVEAKIPKIFTIKGTTSTYVDIEKQKSLEALSFTLKPALVERKTDYDIEFSVSYINENKGYLIEDKKTITVNPRTPNIIIEKKLQGTAYKGELIQVSYTINNKDIESVHDIKLMNSQNQFIDTLNVFEYDIPKLDPGEQITFVAESIRPKQTGTHNVGSSIIYYKDKHTRLFNASSGNPSINVKEANINGPAVIIQKTVSKKLLKPNENALLTINLSNHGLEKGLGKLSDFNSDIEVPLLKNKIFQKNISYDKEGTYLIPASVFYHTYLGNEIRTYSNEIIIKVSSDIQYKEIENSEQEEQTIDTPIVPEPKKLSLIVRFFNWIKNLFTSDG